MPDIDTLDRKILNQLQNDFPLSIQPYKVMADRLQIGEEELLKRITAMKTSGLIRRIGGVMDTRGLGFYSTLCAVSVPIDRVDEVAEFINNIPGVTHNYLRDHKYNLWFTLTVPSQEDAERQLSELESRLNITILNMPADRIFKIRVSFDMESHDDI